MGSAHLHVPTTVQGVLAARIDRLASDEKALLQQLAVIGREFPLGLIRSVISQPEDDLYRLLSSLQRKEFLYEQPAFPEVEYIFKHAVTQEVAYNSVLQNGAKRCTSKQRERLRPYSANLDEHYSELAHHYSRSSNAAEGGGVSQPGRTTSGAALGERGSDHPSHHGPRVAQDLRDTPARARQGPTLQLSLGASLMAVKGYGAAEVEQYLTRARDLCRQWADLRLCASPVWSVGVLCSARERKASLASESSSSPVANRNRILILLLSPMLWLG